MHAHRQLCSKCSALQRHRGAPAAQLCPRDEEGLQAGRGERGPQCHRGQRIKRLGGGGRGGATCSHTTTKQDGTTGRGARANRDEAQPVAGGAPCPPTRGRGPPRRPAAMGSEGNRGTAAPVPSEVGGGEDERRGTVPPRPVPTIRRGGNGPRARRGRHRARRHHPAARLVPLGPTAPGRLRRGTAPAARPCPDLPRAPGLGGPGTPRPSAASPTAGAAGHPSGTAPRGAAGREAGGPADGAEATLHCSPVPGWAIAAPRRRRRARARPRTAAALRDGAVPQFPR